MIMETAFDLLDENARSNFLRILMQTFQCSYVCFWSYVLSPITNCLKFQDGIYLEEFHSQLPSSSSGSLAQRLFYEYQKSTFNIHAENDHIPGFAFRNSIPYLEFQELQLRRLASNETQRQFYQEARIKTAIFMGCKIGEIEIGLSNVPTIKTKMEIQSLFLLEDFQTTQTTSTQPQLAHHEQLNNPIQTDHQNPHYSSSSSSLRSLSNIDSPEYSSLLFNINATSSTNQVPEILSSSSPHTLQVNSPNSLQLQRPILPSPHQEAIQALARLRNPRFPSPETEEQTMTQAILAVLTSSLPFPPLFPSSSSSSSPSSSLAYSSQALINTESSAFKNYSNNLAFPSTSSGMALDHNLGGKKSMFKRSIRFFRSLHYMMRNNRQTLQIPRPNTTQMHHMMSERKRREKLNDSFRALKSLLPPGTRKDKASLLNSTKEFMSSLKAQIADLSQKNKQLEAQIVSLGLAANKEDNHGGGELLVIDHDQSSNCPSSDQRAIDVRLIRHVSESASEDHQQAAEIVDLVVILRAAIPLDELVLRVLEFLKRVENMSMVSLEANTNYLTESRTPINRLTLRLRVEGTEWDESAFQEAVRRVVADLAQ